ncbi:PDZ domain-containing protein [bacterium 210820-DFI.6.52]|nr:PDZ domain-containing protein [bacterium 210820-DFI.6.52]
MNKKVSVGVLISLLAMVCALTFTITMVLSIGLFDNKMNSTKSREAMYSKISEVDTYVRDNYVGELADQNLMDAMLKGYVSGMGDKYARYYTVEEWNSIESTFNGAVTGIGVAGKADTSGYIRVTKVYDGSPAKEAGIEKNDLIIAVDGQDVLAMGVTKAMALIQGDPGSKVKVDFQRDSVKNSVEIIRKSITVPSVEYQNLDGVGYIRIFEFNNTTASQFDYALNQLKSAGARSLIFDVRDNSGGLTKVTAEILDTLVPEGTILSAEYKSGEQKTLYTSGKSEETLPMTVIVNENTASAAEMFAAVLRDFGKAKLVGTGTYGKGVMQEYKQLSDGSGIDITVAYLVPPSGEKFNETGLKPDYKVTLSTQQQQQAHMLTVETDPQIKKAIEVVSAGNNAQGSANASSSAPSSEGQGEEGQPEGGEGEGEGEGSAPAGEPSDSGEGQEAACGPRSWYAL